MKRKTLQLIRDACKHEIRLQDRMNLAHDKAVEIETCYLTSKGAENNTISMRLAELLNILSEE
jgi:hypothetical protein